MNRLKAWLPKLSIVFRWLLLVVVVGFSVAYLVAQWPAVSEAIREIAPMSLLLSFLLVLVGLACGTMSWVAILNGLGPRVNPARGAQVLLVGQLGKYVPGSVWSYVMQMELGRQYGILRPRVLVTALYAAGIGVVSSLLLGALALPTVIQGHPELLWLFVLLPIGLACLHPKVMTFLASLVLKIFRRPPLDHEVRFSVVLIALGWSLASYVAYGFHLWLLVNSLVDPGIPNLILMTGAIALAFTVGLFAFVLPSGVGIREAVLVGAMSLFLTVEQAAGISLVSRGLFTLADLLAAGVAVLGAIILRRRLAREDCPNPYATPVTDSDPSDGVSSVDPEPTGPSAS